ncbi:ATP-binding cassette domain-containing protein [Oceanospirillum sp. D5]|uniref:ATP-binding cassette domain-containing protein n=2 Tax=Oceanospirillum sediminis TaxID=2760088 RepID=A0A839IJI7_9GAMM|nr:ATP-binding cassette domain-containing protein [Oceanospirillum sediminis]
MFRDNRRWLRAVDNVSLNIKRGETLGLVGESGSGKTTLGRAVLRLVEPTGGEVIYRTGKPNPSAKNSSGIDDTKEIDLRTVPMPEMRNFWRQMQMIFQDPYASLNPRMTVRDIIAEPLIVNGLAKGSDLNDKVMEIANICGLNTAWLSRYPHAFSGGQRQRIAIARALVMQPEFIVCDEPISALDVSIQAQILNLLKELQQSLKLTYLFIAHDLAAVAYAADRVAVMYVGQLMEVAPTESLYYQPRHPYTEALMSAIPNPDPDCEMAPVLLEGERPDPASPPPGCRFSTRCPYAVDRCKQSVPELQPVAQDHYVACHRVNELTLKGALELAG